MPRVISFIVLLAIVLLVGAFFFQVMAQFVVPLFLACVLLVVFQPLHGWILERLPKHPRISALITTIVILLVVLLPLVWLGWNAYVELHLLFSPSRMANVAQPATQPVEPTSDATETSERAEEQAFTQRVNNVALQLRDSIREFTRVHIPDQTVRDLVASGSKVLATKALSGVQNAI